MLSKNLLHSFFVSIILISIPFYHIGFYSTAIAAPMSQPRPGPAPMSQPRPGPAPMSQPRPGPAPMSQPRPGPAPMQQPRPGPAPIQQPRPSPAPIQQPQPSPAPIQQPQPSLAPVQKPGQSLANIQPRLTPLGQPIQTQPIPTASPRQPNIGSIASPHQPLLNNNMMNKPSLLNNQLSSLSNIGGGVNPSLKGSNHGGILQQINSVTPSALNSKNTLAGAVGGVSGLTGGLNSHMGSVINQPNNDLNNLTHHDLSPMKLQQTKSLYTDFMNKGFVNNSHDISFLKSMGLSTPDANKVVDPSFRTMNAASEARCIQKELSEKAGVGHNAVSAALTNSGAISNEKILEDQTHHRDVDQSQKMHFNSEQGTAGHGLDRSSNQVSGFTNPNQSISHSDKRNDSLNHQVAQESGKLEQSKLDDAASILLDKGHLNTSQAVRALQTLHATDSQVSSYLQDRGVSKHEINDSISKSQSFGHLNNDQISNIIQCSKDKGLNAGTISQILSGSGATEHQISQGFQQNHFSGSEIQHAMMNTNTCRDKGFNQNNTQGHSNSGGSEKLVDAAQMLKENKISPNNMACALVSGLGANHSEAMNAMQSAGVSHQEATEALHVASQSQVSHTVSDQQANHIVDTLAAQRCVPEQVAQSLYNCGASDQQIANTMNSHGYSSEQISSSINECSNGRSSCSCHNSSCSCSLGQSEGSYSGQSQGYTSQGGGGYASGGEQQSGGSNSDSTLNMFMQLLNNFSSGLGNLGSTMNSNTNNSVQTSNQSIDNTNNSGQTLNQSTGNTNIFEQILTQPSSALESIIMDSNEDKPAMFITKDNEISKPEVAQDKFTTARKSKHDHFVPDKNHKEDKGYENKRSRTLLDMFTPKEGLPKTATIYPLMIMIALSMILIGGICFGFVYLRKFAKK